MGCANSRSRPHVSKLLRGRLPVISIGALATTLAIALTGFTSPAPAAAGAHATSATLTASQTSSPSCTSGTLVHTADGPVCGVTANGVTSYLGIPYAAPPVGKLRWQPPQPVKPWTTTFRATTPGDVCASASVPGVPPAGSEDCLHLRVQVPAQHGSGRLPVMVEIHGGGFLLPIGPSDGSHLVSAGHVVYVAMNYRLGILGFMANKALGPHSGDYGLQDQQAAMRWVQRNIARFGGDPNNVTIFGQSAGGASVCDALTSPTAKGLFQKGISQSGFYNTSLGVNAVWQPTDCKSKLLTEAQAQQAGAKFAANVGCGSAADVLACLRKLPAATLAAHAAHEFTPTGLGTIGPVINGTTLPMSPAKAFATGQINKVRLIIGVDRDEINGAPPTPPGITAARYRALVHQQFGRLAKAVMALYPLYRFPDQSPFIAFRTLFADSASVCPALQAERRLSQYIPVYAYENDDADSPIGFTFVNPSQPNGAYHIAENVFLFPNPTIPIDPNQAAFGSQVTAEWTGFARTGSPTVPGTPLWTRYTEHNRLVLTMVPAGDSALTPTSTLVMQHNCGFWDAVNPPPR